MTATSEANPIHQLVLDAIESRTPLRIAGRSNWIDAGRPVIATRIASLATHHGVVEYVPGDLTMTVRGGTTLREIERVAGAEGQWLPLDPFGAGDGTIGATIATGSFGPLAHGFGRSRDLVLGVEFVTGDGRIVRGGGKVVKNVAGFDLVRLITGSWGTLGIVTEATLRLYSHHGRSLTLAMNVPQHPTALEQALRAVLAAPVVPFACELVSGPMAAWIGLPGRTTLLVRLGGNAAAIEAQRRTLAGLGALTEVAADAWDRLRIAEDKVRSARAVASARARSSRTLLADGEPNATASVVVRVSALPSMTAKTWSAVEAAIAGIDGALMHATPSLGIIRCILPNEAGRETVSRLVAAVSDATIAFERLPAGWWESLSPSVISDRLSQGIRRAFDPHSILNPGILGMDS